MRDPANPAKFGTASGTGAEVTRAEETSSSFRSAGCSNTPPRKPASIGEQNTPTFFYYSRPFKFVIYISYVITFLSLWQTFIYGKDTSIGRIRQTYTRSFLSAILVFAWIEQEYDHVVHCARDRCRSVFKLEEIEPKCHELRNNSIFIFRFARHYFALHLLDLSFSLSLAITYIIKFNNLLDAGPAVLFRAGIFMVLLYIQLHQVKC